MIPKTDGIGRRLAVALDRRQLRFSLHALERIRERLGPHRLDAQDVRRALRKARHNGEKDEFDGSGWRYAFEGVVDGIRIRVPVVLDRAEDNSEIAVVITVIVPGEDE